MSDFELNKAAVRELLKSAEIAEACKTQADAIAQRAGAGFEVETAQAKNRAVATVRAATPEAVDRVNRQNVLLKSVR